jgi:hypothetical protein
MANVTPYDLGISLGTSQVRAKVRHHLWIVARPSLPHRVALDVLVQMWLNKRTTAQMRSTARLPPLTRREANTPCSE